MPRVRQEPANRRNRHWEDFTYRIEHDRKIAQRIVRLIHDIGGRPFEGLGKPDPLKHDLAGFWSWRVTDEHRVVYAVDKNRIPVAQARYHC